MTKDGMAKEETTKVDVTRVGTPEARETASRPPKTGERGASPAPSSAGSVASGPVVSKHPDPTIPVTELSLADIERGRSHPVRWGVLAFAVLVALIAPYWFGRAQAVGNTAWLTAHFGMVTPRGMAFVSWTVTLVAVACLGLAVVDSGRWLWRVLFTLGLAAEQLVAGVSLLKFDFWYSTYVVYGDAAAVANAANLGIIAAGLGVAVFAVVWVGLLVVIRKDSPLNVLTRSWASFILFFAIETVCLMVVLFGGLLPAVGA